MIMYDAILIGYEGMHFVGCAQVTDGHTSKKLCRNIDIWEFFTDSFDHFVDIFL